MDPCLLTVTLVSHIIVTVAIVVVYYFPGRVGMALYGLCHFINPVRWGMIIFISQLRKPKLRDLSYKLRPVAQATA